MISILEKYDFIVGLGNKKGKELFLRKRLNTRTLLPAMALLRDKVKDRKDLDVKAKSIKSLPKE